MNTVETQKAIRPLSNPELISRLRQQAAESKIFNAICYVFAMRERARHQVTVSSLRLTLLKEGFNFKAEDIEQELIFLSNLGVGTIEVSRGHVVSLRGVKITLQSIGKCALSDNEAALKMFKVHNKFNDLSLPKEIKPIVTSKISNSSAIKKEIQQRFYTVPLKTMIGGSEVVIPLSIPLTNEQIALAVASLFENTKK